MNLGFQLALRTVSSSRSAYACFLFAPSFFQHYDDGSAELDTQDSEDSLRCKIAMKVGEKCLISISMVRKHIMLTHPFEKYAE